MNKNEYITFCSDPTKPAMRINKNGKLDKRYKLARELIQTNRAGNWERKTRKPAHGSRIKAGKPMQRRQKTKLSFWEKVGTWFTLLLTVAFFGGAMIYKPASFDASMYKTAHASTLSSKDFSIEGSKAYLEDPRSIEEIKDYIRYKFGDNYSVACMVAYGEGLRSNWINSSPIEYSVGVFQINLADNYGTGRKVHWDKVEGETLRAKADWLQVPRNNVDLAHTMSRGGTSWGAWSAFTNSSYKQFESLCK